MEECYDILIPFTEVKYTPISEICVDENSIAATDIDYYYNGLLIRTKINDNIRINYCDIKQIKKNENSICILLYDAKEYKIISEKEIDANNIFDLINTNKNNIIKIPNNLSNESLDRYHCYIGEYFLGFVIEDKKLIIFYNLIKNIMVDLDRNKLYIEYYFNKKINENLQYSFKLDGWSEEEKGYLTNLINYIHNMKQMKENIPLVTFVEYRSSDDLYEIGTKLCFEKEYLNYFFYKYGLEDGSYEKFGSYEIKYEDIEEFRYYMVSEDKVSISIKTKKEIYDESKNENFKKSYFSSFFINPEIIWLEKLNQFFYGESIPTMASSMSSYKENDKNKLKLALIVSLVLTLIIGIIIPLLFRDKLSIRLNILIFLVTFLIMILKKNKNNDNDIRSDVSNNMIYPSYNESTNTQNYNSSNINYLLDNTTGISIDNNSKSIRIYDNNESPTIVNFNKLKNVEVVEKLSEDIVPQNEMLYDLTTMSGNEKGREYLAERKKIIKKCNRMDIKILFEVSENNISTSTINLINDKVDTDSTFYNNAKDLSKKIELSLNNIIKKESGVK